RRGAERSERMQSVNLYDGDNLIEEMDGNGGCPTSAQPANLGCPTSRETTRHGAPSAGRCHRKTTREWETWATRPSYKQSGTHPSRTDRAKNGAPTVFSRRRLGPGPLIAKDVFS